MTSIISSMLQQMFRKAEFRCLTIGLDASGKTTMLYKLKLGEIVTTIPTIGFNVETVDIASVQLTIWDVGGCDKIRPLWRHYYQNTQALIFIADVKDLGRFDEMQQLFVDTVSDDELRDSVILIFFNKKDLVSTSQLQEYKKKFLSLNEELLQRRTHFTQDCCAPSGEGLFEGFHWLVSTLQNKPSAIAKAAAPQPTEKDKLETQLEEWLSRADEPDDVFLAKLADYTLDSWDHYTHLRIAYVLLRRHGRREGMDRIFRGIKAFIENSPRTKRGGSATDGIPGSDSNNNSNRGTTFHETMTYFWVHMVHYALESSRVMKERTTVKGTTSATSPSVQPAMLPGGGNEWKVFLLMNPQLANGGLFLHYYSKQRMLLDPDSRIMVLLPDKVPLPSLLVDVSKAKSSAGTAGVNTGGSSSQQSNSGADVGALQPRSPLSDSQFLTALVEQKLPGWGHEVKLRIIYLLLCRWGISSRSKDAILDVLRRIEKRGFHYTTSYFWIQLVAYHIAVEVKAQGSGAAVAKGEKTYFSAFNDTQYDVPATMVLSPSVHPPPPPPPLQGPSSVTTSSSNTTAASDSNHQLTPSADGVAAVTVSAVSLRVNSGAEDQQWLERNTPFALFLLRPHCQPLRNPLLYEKYYSRKVLDADHATEGLALPDLKQFPSVV